MPAIGVEEDISTLEDLDLDFELACQAPRHNEPGTVIDGIPLQGHTSDTDAAKWVATATCPGCNLHIDQLVCDARRVQLQSFIAGNTIIVHVTGCGGTHFVDEWNYEFEPLPGGVQ